MSWAVKVKQKEELGWEAKLVAPLHLGIGPANSG